MMTGNCLHVGKTSRCLTLSVHPSVCMHSEYCTSEGWRVTGVLHNESLFLSLKLKF